MADPEPIGGEAPPHPFRAVLTPHRSLSPTGFLLVMAGVGAVSFVTGIAFLLLGAWPMFGFFGLDLLLVYVAFRANYRSGRRTEVVEIDDRRMTLTRIDPAGNTERSELNPYWARVELSEGRDGATRLAVASHGRRILLGAFLTDDERRDLAAALRRALLTARGSPRL